VFQTNGTTEAMRITNNQQVCVGSSTPANPSTLLTVVGNITANATSVAINGATPALSMYDSTWGYAAANGMYFQPGVNGGGTGLGNYFMSNVPSGRGHTWAINNTSAMRLESTGTLTLPYGQIAFPATQNASTDPNTLDDYEEGTWTPTLVGSGGSSGQSYSYQRGYYVKIGRLVYVSCDVNLTTAGTNSGSYCWVAGFPFAASNDPGMKMSPTGYFANFSISNIWVGGDLDPGANYMYLMNITAASGSPGFPSPSFLTNNCRFAFQGCYTT
jgi:hypothetical protein